MLTFDADGFDSLLVPLTIAGALMALLRVTVALCARGTQARDARAIARATQTATGEPHEGA